jgi:sugar transferase (PEP-CTERM/EpsH1 system associated)
MAMRRWRWSLPRRRGIRNSGQNVYSVKILFLVHRVPHPPNRGDRIRSHQLLRWLSARGDVHLACLADEPVSDATRDYLRWQCANMEIAPVGGPRRWARAAWSLARGRTATEGLFALPRLRETVRRWAAETRFDAVIVFCSSMGQYLECPELADVPAIVDLVDVDSEKWFDYAATARGWKKRLFRLEGRRLRDCERRLAGRASAVTVVSQPEAELFGRLCPEANVHCVGNGVDVDYYSPTSASSVEPRHQTDGPPECVFVGALDYRANIDGVVWFCDHVWPDVRRRWPEASLTLVGRQPAAAVRALARRAGVSIAADVPDVRPYLARASLVIAPLRIARGIQNKVLEAAAMAKTVVASPQALTGLDLVPGEHVWQAATPSEWVAMISRLLDRPEHRHAAGTVAREFVVRHYSWEARLSPLERLLAAAVSGSDCITPSRSSRLATVSPAEAPLIETLV